MVGGIVDHSFFERNGMQPYFLLFGRQIPIYGICFYAGIAVAAAFALIICKRRGIERYDVAYSGVYTMIGGILGAKLLFLVVSYRQIIELQLNFTEIIKGGFVFYGGLLGGLAGMAIYAK